MEAGHGNRGVPFKGFTKDGCSSATCISESRLPGQPVMPSATANATEPAIIPSHTLPLQDYKLNQNHSFSLFCSPSSEEHQKKEVIYTLLNPLAFLVISQLGTSTNPRGEQQSPPPAAAASTAPQAEVTGSAPTLQPALGLEKQPLLADGKSHAFFPACTPRQICEDRLKACNFTRKTHVMSCASSLENRYMTVKHYANLHLTIGNRDWCGLWEYQQVATVQHLSPYLNESVLQILLDRIFIKREEIFIKP